MDNKKNGGKLVEKKMVQIICIPFWSNIYMVLSYLVCVASLTSWVLQKGVAKGQSERETTLMRAVQEFQRRKIFYLF